MRKRQRRSQRKRRKTPKKNPMGGRPAKNRERVKKLKNLTAKVRSDFQASKGMNLKQQRKKVTPNY
jgi:hypothetical protein